MNENNGDERRRHNRYDLRSEARYKVGDDGSFRIGRTVNISSGGVLFLADAPIALGVEIELAIAWPMSLGDNALLQLVVQGRVVRTHVQGVAVRIGRYEFRTRARANDPALNIMAPPAI